MGEPAFEPSFVEAFKENPFPFASALFFGALGLTLALVALVLVIKRSRTGLLVGVVAASVGLVAILSGVGGWFSMRSRAFAAVEAPGLSARDRERIITYANGEAAFPLVFGGVMGMLPLLGGVGCAVMARARSQSALR